MPWTPAVSQTKHSASTSLITERPVSAGDCFHNANDRVTLFVQDCRRTQAIYVGSLSSDARRWREVLLHQPFSSLFSRCVRVCVAARSVAFVFTDFWGPARQRGKLDKYVT